MPITLDKEDVPATRGATSSSASSPDRARFAWKNHPPHSSMFSLIVSARGKNSSVATNRLDTEIPLRTRNRSLGPAYNSPSLRSEKQSTVYSGPGRYSRHR
jgi:hypothetical protein